MPISTTIARNMKMPEKEAEKNSTIYPFIFNIPVFPIKQVS